MPSITFWYQCYKTFYERKLLISVISQSASLYMIMSCFLGMEGAYLSETLFGCSPLKGWLMALPTRLEWLARSKHSSLMRKFATYGSKKFYNIGPWYNEAIPIQSEYFSIRAECYKTFYCDKLLTFHGSNVIL
jgi:hypothetical protein